MQNKKGLVTLLLAVMLVGSLTACGIPGRIGRIVTRVKDKLETGEASEASEETEEYTRAATVVPYTEDGSGDGSSDASQAMEWADAYLAYIRKMDDEALEDYDRLEYRTFDYIYVDEDDIPELLIQGSDEATGNLILTCHNGVIDELQTNRLNFNYIKKGNRLLNSDGNMGYYYDMIYSIEDGKWVLQYNGQYNVENNSVEWDDDDLRYFWNDSECSKEEYYTRLAAAYDEGKASPGAAVLSFSQIKEKLTNDSIGYENPYLEDDTAIHKYEVIVADVTWDEAMADCRKRGGYLLRLNTWEEKNYIETMLKENKQEKLVIWLGGGYNAKDGHYHWYDGEKYAMAALDESSYFRYDWLDGEPSFTGQDANGNIVDERYMCMFHTSKDYERWVWNDTVSDLRPYYPGRVAYICEME